MLTGKKYKGASGVVKIFCVFIGLWIELYTSDLYSLEYVSYSLIQLFFEIIKPYRLWLAQALKELLVWMTVYSQMFIGEWAQKNTVTHRIWMVTVSLTDLFSGVTGNEKEGTFEPEMSSQKPCQRLLFRNTGWNLPLFRYKVPSNWIYWLLPQLPASLTFLWTSSVARWSFKMIWLSLWIDCAQRGGTPMMPQQTQLVQRQDWF